MKRTYLQLPAAVLVAACLFSCKKDMSGKSASGLNESLSASPSNTLQLSCGQHRTQTQGGWGASPSGNNPGTYLHANFNAVFGDSLSVGCPGSNFYIKLTSAQAVTNLLPVGGKASALTANTTNPAALKNVLVGQLVALKLSVAFDAEDDNFGDSPVELGNMIIGSGRFKGYSVYEFLNLAEKVLGGCNTDFSLTEVNETASSINENNVDGKIDNGFLVCPDGGDNEPPIEA